MPSCDAQWLAGYLFEIGPATAGNPISHSEIESWQRNTGIELDAWEARTLRRLSTEYLKESYKATARDCPAPFSSTETIEQIRAVVDNKFRAFMSGNKVSRG